MIEDTQRTVVALSIFYDIGNFVPYIIKTLRGMRARAKRKFVASDRARRENVPGHILFWVIGNFNPYIIKTLRGDAHSREEEVCRRRPRSARECARAHSFFGYRKLQSLYHKNPPGDARSREEEVCRID